MPTTKEILNEMIPDRAAVSAMMADKDAFEALTPEEKASWCERGMAVLTAQRDVIFPDAAPFDPEAC